MRNHNVRWAGLALGLALSCTPSWAQRQGTGSPPSSPPPSGGGTGGGTGGRPTGTNTAPFPTDGRDQTSQFPELNRGLFLSGKVLMDDGSPPPEAVTIQRICGGNVRPEAYTDSKGRFSFELGRGMNVMPDASVGASNGAAGDPMTARGGNRANGMGFGAMTVQLATCDLQAALPGYQSDRISLAGRRPLDNPDVGAIILHRLANVEGTTVSVTSLLAPKEAKKAFEKASGEMKRQKWAGAQRQFESAVAVYPRYAAAWYGLGQAYAAQDNFEQARTAFERALKEDPKFLKPYLELATIDLKEKKWDSLAKTSAELIRLDPVDFPGAYYYNSVGNYNLRNLDVAENSAREGVKHDPSHRVPALEHVLGVILANKGDFAGGAKFLRSYLEHAPNSSNADVIRKQLADIDRLAGQSAAQAKPAPQAAH